MQVGNQIAFDYGKLNSVSRQKNYSSHKITFANEHGQNLHVNQEENQKKGFSIKKATNIAGVAAWLFVVGYSAYKLKLLNHKSPEMILDGAKALKKRAMGYAEKLANPEANDLDKQLEGVKNKFVIKTLYKVGDWFRNQEMKVGTELFNNLTYAFGTIVVMPFVVLFSPFGKKDSTKEDKIFQVLRQPLSVTSTLGMQYTFDKLINKYVPEAIKKNSLEDKSILDRKGEVRLVDKQGKFLYENFENIKFNADAAKKGFKILAEKVLSKDEVKKLFTNASFEGDDSKIYKGKMLDILNTKYKEFGLKLKNLEMIDAGDEIESIATFKRENGEVAAEIKNLLAKFHTYTSVLDRSKMAVTKSKVMVNILASAAIGCTFLNVIYGKSMKVFQKYKDRNLDMQNNQLKEVK